MIKETQATAVWKGDLKGGTGVIDSQYGALKHAEYNFSKRFEAERGINPEELIAAALAACFSMALSGELAKSRITADSISTTATARLDMVDGKPTMSEVHLTTEVSAGGADPQLIHAAAENARTGCPVARILNTNITLDVSVA